MKLNFKIESLIMAIWIVAYNFIGNQLWIFGSIILSVLFLLTQYKKKINFKLFNNILYLLIPIFLGVSATIVLDTEFFNTDSIRDIYYILIPIISYFFGLIMSIIMDNKDIKDTIVISTILTILIDIFKIASYNQYDNFKFLEFRDYMGVSDYILVVGLFVLLLENKYNRNIKVILIIILLVDITIYFSRISILFVLITFILYLFNKFKYLKNNSKELKTITLVTIVGFFLLILINILFPEFSEKVLYTFEELSSNNNWSKIENISLNWRGYEIYCAKLDIKNNFGLIEYLLGNGFGYRTPLTILYNIGGIDYLSLPILHNGFYSIFSKYGVIGLLSYICFFIMYIKNIRKSRNINVKIIASSICLFLVISTFFVMGIFYESQLCLLVLLMGLYYGNLYVRGLS